jgi:hypothetical protein
MEICKNAYISLVRMWCWFMNFDFLLKEYRTIWNHRLLNTEESSSEQVLKEAIKRELLDENSHPRIRRNYYEKYYFSIKRITSSSILPEAKLSLIQLHNLQMEQIKGEIESST